MKGSQPEEVVTVGSHVIIQKLNYKKVYRVSETGSLAIGKEEIKMSPIIGKPFWTTFKVIAPQEKRAKGAKRGPPSSLIVAEKSDSLEDLKKAVTSGFDNRSINDDGKSQKLSKDDILGLRDAGKSGREIVSSLIENNASFAEKTEYSQEKYIRKKEKKYCQFLSVHKPTLASLQEIYLRQDPTKMYGLRMDTLGQILSYSDVKAEGSFILYDSGTVGLAAAGMMSRIGANTTGKLVYLHSGDHLPQLPIVRAMNFPQEQLGRMTIVSIFDFLRTYNKDKGESVTEPDQMDIPVEKAIAVEDSNGSDKDQNSSEKADGKSVTKPHKMDIPVEKAIAVADSNGSDKDQNSSEKADGESVTKPDKIDIPVEKAIAVEDSNGSDKDQNSSEKADDSGHGNVDDCQESKCDTVNSNSLKREHSDSLPEEGPPVKKSRKVLDTERAVEVLRESKADGLAIVTKEHPLNIVQGLLPFVKSSRPFVIYHGHREPLQETYVALKQQSNIVNLRLFSNFLRSYQVLPDRTHPDILTNDCGGYVLCGYTVC